MGFSAHCAAQQRNKRPGIASKSRRRSSCESWRAAALEAGAPETWRTRAMDRGVLMPRSIQSHRLPHYWPRRRWHMPETAAGGRRANAVLFLRWVRHRAPGNYRSEVTRVKFRLEITADSKYLSPPAWPIPVPVITRNRTEPLRRPFLNTTEYGLTLSIMLCCNSNCNSNFQNFLTGIQLIYH